VELSRAIRKTLQIATGHILTGGFLDCSLTGLSMEIWKKREAEIFRSWKIQWTINKNAS
jgi:hypothetical protein